MQLCSREYIQFVFSSALSQVIMRTVLCVTNLSLPLTADLPVAPSSPQRVSLLNGFSEGASEALAQQQPNGQPHRYEMP